MFGAIACKRLKHNIVFGILGEVNYFFDINSHCVNSKTNKALKDVYKIIECNNDTFVTFGRTSVKIFKE